VQPLRHGLRLRQRRHERRLLVRGRGVSVADAQVRGPGLPVPELPARDGIVGRYRAGRRMTRKLAIAGCALAALIATTPYLAAQQSRSISMLGQWEIIEAVPAPWADEKNHAALAAEGKRMLKLVITFEPKAVKSTNRAFECKRAVIYEPNEIESDALFQGNLPEPNPTAAAIRLGFKRGDIPGVDVRCLKAQYTFHFRDADTAMFSLNRVIYTLKRR
jgi:hypothetical protein